MHYWYLYGKKIVDKKKNAAQLLLPPFRALSVFSLSSNTVALFTGSFWSPALITSAVRGLQSGGISLTGGGSRAICNHHKMNSIRVWWEYGEENVRTGVKKRQAVMKCVPSDKVYRCSIASKVDTHWACAVTYSSCSTHLLWLLGVPLSQFRGPCGSLCLSNLHWITLITVK